MLHDIFDEILFLSESSYIRKFDNPEELSDWMSENIKYGFLATNDRIYLDFDQFVDYKLQSPYEVYKNKVGVCWDQTFFEAYIFKRYLKIKYKIFFIITDDENNTTHTFLVYYKNNKVYYFENSYEKYRGIHEFNSDKDVIKFVINNMKNDFGIKEYELREIIKQPNFGCKGSEFVNFCLNDNKMITI